MTADRSKASPRSPASERRGRRTLSAFEWTMLVVAAAGLTGLLVIPPPAEPVAAPPLDLVATPGGQVAKVDDARWRSACAAAGLPAPPALDGTDPVPTRTILESFDTWTREGDPAALGRMGQVYLAVEEHEAALWIFAAAAQLAPAEPRWCYLAAAEAEVLGRVDLAERLFEKSLRLDPEYATTLARLGSLSMQRGDLDAAAAAFATYCERRPKESLGYVGLGRIALARGDHTEAERHLRAAIARTPNDFLAHRFLARALAESGRADDARRAARISDRLPRYAGWLSFDPRLREAHSVANTRRHLTNRMRAAMSVQDLDAFVPAAEELLHRYPSDIDTAANLVRVYRGLDRLDDADRLVDRAQRLDPNSAEVVRLRAEIAFQRRDFAAVHRALDAAERLDGDLPRIHDVRGRALFLQGRLGDAITSMTRAAELSPAHSGIRLALAEMHHRAGDTERAIELIREVQREDPENPVAARLLESVTGSGPPTP